METVQSAAHSNSNETSSPLQSQNEPERKPWGSLISTTAGRPNIKLFSNSTGIAQLFDVVDIDTGERLHEFSIFLFTYYY